MVRVDSKGRIVLPSEVRDRLGIRPGSDVEVTAENGRVVVEPEDDPDQIMHNLEAMIEAAAANRECRREDESEGMGLTLDEDPIAAKQREIIRRGAKRAKSDTQNGSE
jgi:AbrB family looped-hinge helix DNA binding protein